ncbi:MAG: RagB/SusD family nutrient uptake outer membrane protein [Bacteroidia bacterium]|nr:RagB/SusD family nutrient uptake outer membrane protein [Bacteroidia bacterium]
MKKILIFLAALLLVAGCSESFLDTKDLTRKTTENFPATPSEANQALTGVYNIMYSTGGIDNIMLISDIMSDDRLGGGGQNDRDPQAMEYFLVKIPNEYANPWAQPYKGIFRANSLLSSLDKVEWGTETAEKSRIFGEVSFLRAYYYFDLARMFGPVPLVTAPTPANNPKATPAALYGQIALDLKNAINALPDDPITTAWRATNMGRVTKWAAEGYMARVFLFYTGYYEQTELPVADGTTITKDDVIAWVDDLVANSGRSLVPDFRNLWPYAINEATNYGYALTNGLNWVGDQGNTETIFEIAYVGLNSDVWGTNSYYNNTVNLFCGHRDPTYRRPFGHGWGFGPVNPVFVSSWSSLDLRKKGSIWDQNDATEGTDTYLFAADMQWHETYLYEKKYIPVNIDFGGNIVNYSVKLYGAQNDMMLNNTQSLVLLRLADVLLMGAELGSSNAQAYFDLVTNRANSVNMGLAPTLDRIQNERRWELAFEGLRYFDLLRWYRGGAGAIIQTNESGADIRNNGVATTINVSDNGVFANIDARVTATGGFLMIPDDQIKLSNGVLVQNAGWTNANEYQY